MIVSRQGDPRANQKARTRKALVDAAAALFRQGRPPTVAEAAGEARVSRATAYRYFPTQEALLVEVADIAPMTQPVEDLLAGLPAGDAEERLLRLVDTFNRIVLAGEAPMRTALRVYLDTWLASRRAGSEVPRVREGRRMRWLDDVLAPVDRDLTPKQWRRLRSALALTLSIDAIVVMKDVCGLDDEEALAVLRWAALALLRAGLSEGKTAERRRAKPASASRSATG
jgi:AcrR family transcriptional regulator